MLNPGIIQLIDASCAYRYIHCLGSGKVALENWWMSSV